MTQRQLIRNIALVQDVGDTPYELLRPCLRKIADPQQLRTIEIASPHIADSSAELWQAFIKRDIPNYKDKLVEPKNPRSWWKVYRKLWREEQATREQQERELKEVLDGKKREKEANTTQFLNAVVQQPERQKKMLDGNVNPKAGSFGYERVGSVANAKKKGQNIISAIRKAATKPTHVRPADRPGGSGAAQGQVQSKMWQTPILPPGRRKNAPNLLRRGPPTAREAAQSAAMERAVREDQKLREERAQRMSNSPPRGQQQSPPRTTGAAEKASKTATPQRPAAPTAANRPAASLGAGAGTKRPLENASPAPPQKRTRAAPSIFMPSKNRVKR